MYQLAVIIVLDFFNHLLSLVLVLIYHHRTVRSRRSLACSFKIVGDKHQMRSKLDAGT